MVNFTSEQLQKLLSNPKQIRNLLFVPDSPSTPPFVDRLISEAGISLQHEDEKSNLPTLDSIPNTSLYYQPKSEPPNTLPPYLINLLYTPNCPHLPSEIVANSGLADGALFVMDYIRGVTPLFESMLRHVLSENMKHILVINNIYQAISEFQQDPELIYQKIVQVLDSVNLIRSSYSQTSDKTDIVLKPENNNVAFEFGSKGSWVFTINKFSAIYAKKWNVNADKLNEKLWGDHYFDAQTKKWTKEPVTQDGRVLTRCFIDFILRPIIKLAKILTNCNEEQLDQALARIPVVLSPEEKALKGIDLIETVLLKRIDGSECLLEMIVTHIPSPQVAQAQRINNLYEGLHDDACAKAIMECNPQGPLMMFVSRLVPTSDSGRFFALARVFSGAVSQGQKIRIMGPNYRPGKKDDLYDKTIQRVVFLTGRSVEPMDNVPCGTVVGIVGIDRYILKTATISDSECAATIKTRNQFHNISPVVRVAVESRLPEDLPKLIEGLQRLTRSDRLVHVMQDELGQHIVGGIDQIHLEACLENLRNKFAACEIRVSDFHWSYRETVTEESSQTCLAKSANKHSRFYGKARPLTESLAQFIETGELGPNLSNKERAKALCEEFGWDKSDAMRIWAFGPEGNGPNVFVDVTKGVQFLHEIQDSAIASFQWACKEGVLSEEPWRQIRIDLEDATMMVDAIHRGGGQIIPAIRRLCYACELTAQPRLQEAVFLREIILQKDNLGQLYQDIQTRRGQVVEEENIKGTNLVRITFYLPGADSLGFDSSLKLDPSVYSSCGSIFNHWELIPSNPLDPSSIAYDIVARIRKMKGLNQDIRPLSDFLDRL